MATPEHAEVFPSVHLPDLLATAVVQGHLNLPSRSVHRMLASDETPILLFLSVMARVLLLDSSQDSSQHSLRVYFLEFVASPVEETELFMALTLHSTVLTCPSPRCFI